MACRKYAPKQQTQEAQKAQEAERLIQLEREQERAWEICREYVANTQKSELTQAAILKGLKTGENPYRLLLAACECIGFLVGNQAFSESVRANIEAIQGFALQEPEALELVLEGINQRLAVMKKKELEAESEEARIRIQAAIRAHRQRAEEIERVIGKRDSPTA